MDKVVFGGHGIGGLGDVLLYSTLPELWSNQGYKVYLQDIHFRNGDIRDMLLLNPFVSGITSIGTTYRMDNDARLAALCMQLHNSIKGTEAYFGFEPKNTYPKVYFDLKNISEFNNKIIIDYNAITAPFTQTQIEQYLNRLLQYNALILEDAMITLPHHQTLPFHALNLPIYKINSLSQYANIINSCKTFITVSSGAAALASAIKQDRDIPNVYCLIHNAIYNKHVWRWNNLDYFMTGTSHPDYSCF